MTGAKSKTNEQPNSDAHLTDHEWRLKMAAEGKAFYVPGKSVAEIKAEIGQSVTFPDAVSPIQAWQDARAAGGNNQAIRNGQEGQAMINVAMTEEQYRKFEGAMGEVPYLLSHAGNVFDFLFAVRSGGFTADESGFLSILELCGRAFQSAAEQEGATLAELDSMMRAAAAAQYKNQLQPST